MKSEFKKIASTGSSINTINIFFLLFLYSIDDKALEELKQKLQEANQNLTTQVEARNNLVFQQNILMDILEIPKDQRHFETFRQRILSNQNELNNLKISMKENNVDEMENDSKDFTTLDQSSISRNS